MPGMVEFSAKLKQDDWRHVAHGTHLIFQLVAENGDEVWKAI